MHTPTHSQTLTQIGLWAGQDPSWPLFLYVVAQSLRKTALSPLNRRRQHTHADRLPVEICLSDKSNYINRVVKWICLFDGGDTERGRTANIKTKRQSALRAYWYSPSLVCHCSFSSPNPRNEQLFQPRCSISPQGHGETQYNYLRQRHGWKQRLVRNIRKCPQDIKSQGKLPFRVMIYSFRETDSRTI